MALCFIQGHPRFALVPCLQSNNALIQAGGNPTQNVHTGDGDTVQSGPINGAGGSSATATTGEQGTHIMQHDFELHFQAQATQHHCTSAVHETRCAGSVVADEVQLGCIACCSHCREMAVNCQLLPLPSLDSLSIALKLYCIHTALHSYSIASTICGDCWLQMALAMQQLALK